MRFIPVDKLSKLREAAKNGDERAKKIIRAQMNDEDFSSDLDSYFSSEKVIEKKSLPNKNGKLEQFLLDNGVKEGDEDYESYVEDFYREFPNEKTEVEAEKKEESVISRLKKEEIDAMGSYSKAITEIMNDPDIEETIKKIIVSRFKEIWQDEDEHFQQLTEIEEMLNNLNKNKMPE